MNAHELLRSIQAVEKTLSEQDNAAQAVLIQGVARLHEAATKYPGTAAAVQAARALETLGYYVTREGRLERHEASGTSEKNDGPATVPTGETLTTPADEDEEISSPPQ